MINSKALEFWFKSLGALVCLALVLAIAQPAEAALFHDPNPRVMAVQLPVTTTPQANSTVYVVKKGDTLSEIAKKYQVDLGQLISQNQIQNPNRMSIGQILHIPAIGAGDRQPIIYQVVAGDTLWDIANKYKLKVETLLAHNELKNPDQLRIGQKLVIPVDNSQPVMGTQMLASRSSPPSSFDWPTEGVITSKYGRRWGEFHYGLDIANDTGTPIKAAAGGTVIFAGWGGNYGNLVVLQHDEVYRTLYAHNSKLLVEEGQWVAREQEIAKMGSTGRSTGPHLHFEVHQNEKALDPLRFLPR